MSITFSHYCSQPSQGLWVYANITRLTLSANSNQSLDCLVLIKLISEDHNLNIAQTTNQINLRLKELGKRFDQVELSRFEALVGSQLQQYHQNFGNKIRISCGYIAGDTLILGATRSASQSWLIRAGKVGTILPLRDSTQVVSGKLQADDMICIGNDVFTNKLGYQHLSHQIGNSDQIDLSDVTNNLVTASHELSGVGFILGLVEADKPDPNLNKPTSSLFNRIWSWFKKLKPNPIQPSVYVRDQKQRRFAWLGFSVLLVVAVFTLLATRWNHQRQLRLEQANQRLAPAEALLAEAELLAQTNTLKSRDLLLEASQSLQPLLSQSDSDQFLLQRAGQIQAQIGQLYQEVSKEFTLKPEVFMDLNIVLPGFYAALATVSDGRIYLADTNQGVVISLGLERKDPSQPITDSLVKQASSIAFNQDPAVLTGSSVWTVSQSGNQQVIDGSEIWQDVGGLAGFATNYYILDRQLGEIWRYRDRGDLGFGRERWLAPGVRPDFSQVVDWQIDGDIWVFDTNGQVRRYSSGVGESIALTGVNQEVVIQSGSVTEDYIFIYDPNLNRIWCFNRQGSYQFAVNLVEVGGVVSDIYAWQDQIILVTGERLLSLYWGDKI